jgi:tRNA-2-methylthio-N6-dimethylallyladenosine synthase
MKKVFIKTFGCQMNEYDSDKMADVMRAAEGYEPTQDPEQADLILFNTCSVREKAQEKVFSDLGRVKHLKSKGVLIGVGGCVASQEGAAIIERAPYVDVVFGPQTLHRLPELLAERERQNRPAGGHPLPRDREVRPPAAGAGRRPTAFVSIMEGCSKYCSYCVVPYTRGEEVSRPLDDVLAEVAELADQGVREVTLLGQNVNAWRGRMGDTAEIADFALLLEYVAEIPGIERIRYTTSHPNEFTQRLVEAYGKVDKLVSHLHLPVQHGSDRILMAMKRGYTAMEYRSTIRKLRAVRPDLSLSSDFIVGFPGETDDDFAKLMKLVDDVGYDASFSFIFSPRPGTPAAALHDDTPHAVKLRGCSTCRRCWRTTCAHQRQPRRHRAAHPGRRSVAQGQDRADGPHRLQPHRQLRAALGVQYDVLMTQSRDAAARALRLSGASQSLAERSAAMERAGRQSLVLNDAVLRRRFDDAAREAHQVLRRLENNGLAPAGIEMWRAQLGVIEGLLSGPQRRQRPGARKHHGRCSSASSTR